MNNANPKCTLKWSAFNDEKRNERNKQQWASSCCFCYVCTPQCSAMRCNAMQYNVLRACKASECDFVTHAEEVSMRTFSHKTFFLHDLNSQWNVLSLTFSSQQWWWWLGLDFDNISTTTIQFMLIGLSMLSFVVCRIKERIEHVFELNVLA